MATFLNFTVIGLVFGCIYALTASGLVVTYTTSGIFNFAHGAIGMIAAWAYWQMRIGWHWPTPVAVVVVLGVLAPIFGALIERVLIRPLRGAAVDLTLVVTLGLFLFLIGLTNLLWKQTVIRVLPQFYRGHSVRVLGFSVTYNQLIVIVVALVAAAGLRYLFVRTRTGVAMRAVVDNPDLLAMAGGPPVRIQQLSWVLGAEMAALAGLLLAPIETLTVVPLTLFVINAYAAAVFGRLRSLPMTVLGALLVGLGTSYMVGYAPGGFLRKAQLIIPMILLFAVVIAMRPAQLKLRSIASSPTPRPAGLRSSLVAGGALVVAAVVVGPHLSVTNLKDASHGVAFALIVLSLVLLTGYGGMVSLCQMTFAGLGAWAMSHIGGVGGSPLGLLAAAALAGGVGALVALPTLRLRGLYLALATFAFAQSMDTVFFVDRFGTGGSIAVARVHLPGIPRTDHAYFVELVVVFALAGIAVLAVRRGRVGRRLTCIDDSPAACATLGLNINWTKLVIFTVAAAMAGVGGALYAAVPGQASNNDFVLLLSLTALLLARIGGINTVSGVFIGAMFFSGFTILQEHVASLARANIQYLLTGLGAISLGRDPNGLGGQIASLAARLKPQPVAPAISVPVVADAAMPPARRERPPDDLTLSVEEVSVRFGGVQALDGVDLTARWGEVTGLIGPNGAGKTTLFNAITGLERSYRGTVRLGGHRLDALPPYRRARLGVARTFQRLEPFGSLTVRENILAAAEFRNGWADDKRDARLEVDGILTRLGLASVANDRVDALPTGQARLVELGRAMAARPSLLLLDEPSSGLSPSETEAFGAVLREIIGDGTSILIVEHDVDLVMGICDRIHVLDFGRIIASGTPAEVQHDPMVQEAYLGAETVEVVHR